MTSTPIYWNQPDLFSTECRILDVTHTDDTGSADMWDLLLEDSPFYPGGGGQPADRGRIGGFEITSISKKDGRIHYRIQAAKNASGELKAGSTVHCEVDSAFRLDSMQQHSGQHLLSAALAKEGLATVSVHLGAQYCGIEVDAADLDDGLPERILTQCDRWIREDRPILSRLVNADDPTLAELRRPLSEKTTGESESNRPVRVVEIQGVDAVGCGGVHLTRTGAVIGIVYAGTEKIRGRLRLKWIIGDRVIRQARHHASVLEAACRLLSAEVPQLQDRVESMVSENLENARLLATAESMLGALLCRQTAADSVRRPEDSILAGEIGGTSDRMRGALEAALELKVKAALFLGEAGPDGSRPWGIHLCEDSAGRFNQIHDRLIKPASGRGGGRHPFWRGIVEGDPEGLMSEFTGLLEQEQLP